MLTPPLLLAAASAGMLGGLHCIGMCGGISSMLTASGKNQHPVIPIKPVTTLKSPNIASWLIPLKLHSGRIFTYTLMGAIAGSLGTAGIQLNPLMPIHTIMYIIGNLALIWLGLRLFGYSPSLVIFDRLVAYFTSHIYLSKRFSILRQTNRFPFTVGMLWGLLPCGLVYGVLPFALISGHALSGAIILLIFGLSALPHLLFAQTIAHWKNRSKIPAALRITGGTVLTALGIAGIWWSFNMQALPGFLCITPGG